MEKKDTTMPKTFLFGRKTRWFLARNRVNWLWTTNNGYLAVVLFLAMAASTKDTVVVVVARGTI